jgi:hypothetical protein
MKTLCITGSAENFLKKIAVQIEKAGAGKPLASKREPDMTMMAWHAKVMMTISSQNALDRKKTKIGKVWEQFAGDIFFSNHHQALWYWEDERSVYLLDFWAEFDPSVCFLIVHTSLELTLQIGLANKKANPEDAHLLLNEWNRKTDTILKFQNANPTNCEIVDLEEYCADPKRFIESISKKWNLNLSTLDAGNISTPALKPELFELTATMAGDDLKITQFKDLIRRTKLHPSESKKEQYRLHVLERATATSAHPLNDSQSKQAENKELLLQLLNLQDLFEELTWNYKNLLRQNSKRETSVITNANKSIAAKSAQEKTQELLSQLHTTQEMLEEKTTQLINSETAAEQLKKLTKQILSNTKRKWLLGFIEWKTVKPSNTNEPGLAKVFIESLLINDKIIPSFEIELHYSENMAGITFLRKDIEASAPLQKWPEQLNHSFTFNCTPCQGSAFSGANAPISSLSTSDWSFVRSLIETLIELTQENRDVLLPDKEAAKVSKGLLALKRSFIEWPTLLRSDEIKLVKKLKTDNYQALEFRTENLTVGEKTWPAINYRIATVDEPTGEFGQNPRIELLASTEDHVESWFIESDDPERGPRLELRFAEPAMMDIPIWNRLSGQDKLLVTALITHSQQQLASHGLSATERHNWKSVLAGIAATLKHHNGGSTNSTVKAVSR